MKSAIRNLNPHIVIYYEDPTKTPILGIGKTRLLEEIVIISQNIDANLHVVNISTSFDIMKDNFKIVRIIIEDLLGRCGHIILKYSHLL